MPFSLSNVVRDIKSLKIQGAESVSSESVKAIKNLALSSKESSVKSFLDSIKKAMHALVSARPTEPYLVNSLSYIFKNISSSTISQLKEEIISSSQNVLVQMENNKRQIAEIGAKKIRNGTSVFTHCHSSTVISILLEAKKQGKRFEVHNTETRPVFQGRKTAEELSRAGIKVTHYVDSAARLAIKNSDIMLIGADAITSEGKVINKIGSEMFADIAQKYDVPVYSCTSSWKFDPNSVFGFTTEIEERPASEVWKNRPKNIKINNYAFEILSPDSVTGIITELGIYAPIILVEEIKRAYPWMLG